MKKLPLILLFLAIGFIFLSATNIQTGTAKPDTAQVVATVQTAPTATTPASNTPTATVQNSAATAPHPIQTTTVPGATTVTAAQTTTVTTPTAIGSCKLATDDIRRWIGYALIIIIIVVFFITAKKTSLLRVDVTDPAAFMVVASTTTKYRNETDINKIPKPFSLSRSQLAVWTIVIGCSYVYLELCKYVSSPIVAVDKTLLALMGISAATTAASNVIDNHATPDQQGLLRPSEGFFKDILSDQNSINIHRFQNVLWTVIAVTLYICQVPDAPCGQLPTLDTTLIGLTGISSATYLGLKINENKPPAIPPTQSTTGTSTVIPPASSPEGL